MNKTLKDFVKIYDMIPKDVCDKIVEELKSANFERHTFYVPRNQALIKNEIEPMYTYDKIPSHDIAMKYIWDSLRQYILRDFTQPYFDGWEGYAAPKYNKYEVGEEMKMHCDHIQSLFDGVRKGIPIVTLVAALNDDYEGGDFILNEERIRLKQGQVIMFPSNFLYPHKVDTITKGTRYTFVSWVW